MSHWIRTISGGLVRADQIVLILPGHITNTNGAPVAKAVCLEGAGDEPVLLQDNGITVDEVADIVTRALAEATLPGQQISVAQVKYFAGAAR